MNNSEYLTDSDEALQSGSSGNDPKFPLSFITKLSLGSFKKRTKSDLETHTGKKLSFSVSSKNIASVPVTGHEKKKVEDLNTVSHKCEPGFFNLGNTCYLNASLQCLLHSECFLQQIRAQGVHLNGTSHTQFCVLDQLYKLVQKYYDQNSPHAMNLSVFVDNIRRICPFFVPHQQQDADEFIQLLFQGIDNVQCNGCADAPFKNESYPNEIGLILRNSVVGYMKTTITCTTCRQSSTSRTPFTKLSLAVGSDETAQECLTSFMADEILEGDNAYLCPHCQAISSAVIKKNMDDLPNLLILQFKRFDAVSKVDQFVSYPQVLDLHAYCCPDNVSQEYELVSVITHKGPSTNFGHYIADLKCVDGHWCRADDHKRSKISLSECLNNKAYILFYQKRKQLLGYDDVPESNQNGSNGIGKGGGGDYNFEQQQESAMLNNAPEKDNIGAPKIVNKDSFDGFIGSEYVPKLSSAAASEQLGKKAKGCCSII